MNDDSFSHQDWKPVVFTNPKLVKKELERNGETVSKQKLTSDQFQDKKI